MAEVTVAGRPAILVPLPIAASDEQSANARALVAAGAAWMIPQAELTPDRLAAMLVELLGDRDALARAATAARAIGRPDAAARLADMIEGCLHPMASAA